MPTPTLSLRIGTKLLAGFAAVVIGFALVLVYVDANLRDFSAYSERESALFVARFDRVRESKEIEANVFRQRALLLRIAETISADNARLWSEWEQRRDKNRVLLERIRARQGQNPEVIRRIDALEAVLSAWFEFNLESVAPLLRAGDEKAARELLHGQAADLAEALASRVQDLVLYADARVDQGIEELRASLLGMRDRVLYAGIALAGLAALLAYLLSRNISQPLTRITAVAKQIGRGEIPADFAVAPRNDEIGELGVSFAAMTASLRQVVNMAELIGRGEIPESLANRGDDPNQLVQAFGRMAQSLRELLLEIEQGVGVLATSGEEILAVTAQVASGTAETATAISEIATTIEEVKQTAVVAGTRSQAVLESVERTTAEAQNGRRSVEESLRDMEQIREQMQAVAESIMRLGEQSQAIGEIVASVGELAEQSNLLGVNASIEAAKAGEAGKGFAVVAQEVKALADQSKQATAQVRGILGEIQRAMTKAVLLAEQSGKTVEVGYERARTSGELIQTLHERILENSDTATQIAASSQQQRIGVDQIAQAIENIRKASQDNVAGTRQVDLAARNLSQLGTKLKARVSRFRL